MTDPTRRSIPRAAILAPLAMVLTQLLHELGHLVALYATGSDGMRLGLFEVTGIARAGVGTFAILAGPAASAAVGVLAWRLRRRWARPDGAPAAFLGWLESLAISYLCVSLALAPLASSDASRLLETVDAPSWLALVPVPIGIALLLLAGGAHQAWLARSSVAGPLALVAGWIAILLTQAVLLRSPDWLFVACMAIAAVPALADRRLVDAPRG